ncbi:hypothetical protein DIPPA_24609 [Diplonema papillatum]|nr:hypothetical protein DIPPA_24609 [Diplonema papillatum]
MTGAGRGGPRARGGSPARGLIAHPPQQSSAPATGPRQKPPPGGAEGTPGAAAAGKTAKTLRRLLRAGEAQQPQLTRILRFALAPVRPRKRRRYPMRRLETSVGTFVFEHRELPGSRCFAKNARRLNAADGTWTYLGDADLPLGRPEVVSPKPLIATCAYYDLLLAETSMPGGCKARFYPGTYDGDDRLVCQLEGVGALAVQEFDNAHRGKSADHLLRMHVLSQAQDGARVYSHLVCTAANHPLAACDPPLTLSRRNKTELIFAAVEVHARGGFSRGYTIREDAIWVTRGARGKAATLRLEYLYDRPPAAYDPTQLSGLCAILGWEGVAPPASLDGVTDFLRSCCAAAVFGAGVSACVVRGAAAAAPAAAAVDWQEAAAWPRHPQLRLVPGPRRALHCFRVGHDRAEHLFSGEFASFSAAERADPDSRRRVCFEVDPLHLRFAGRDDAPAAFDVCEADSAVFRLVCDTSSGAAYLPGLVEGNGLAYALQDVHLAAEFPPRGLRAPPPPVDRCERIPRRTSTLANLLLRAEPEPGRAAGVNGNWPDPFDPARGGVTRVEWAADGGDAVVLKGRGVGGRRVRAVQLGGEAAAGFVVCADALAQVGACLAAAGVEARLGLGGDSVVLRQPDSAADAFFLARPPQPAAATAPPPRGSHPVLTGFLIARVLFAPVCPCPVAYDRAAASLYFDPPDPRRRPAEALAGLRRDMRGLMGGAPLAEIAFEAALAFLALRKWPGRFENEDIREKLAMDAESFHALCFKELEACS